jgi:gliding motility-associated-like protein
MRILILLLFVSGTVQAQLFVEKQILKLDKQIHSAEAVSADFDNDGLQDVALFVKRMVNGYQINFLKGDTVNGFTILHDSTALDIESYTSFSLVDYDNDNDLDILVFGNTTSLFQNEGDFSFTEHEVMLPAFVLSKWIDLDNNGSLEIFGSFEQAGEWITGVFVLQSGDVWKLKGDTLAFNLTAIEVVEANDDGYQDLFISGRHGTDSLFSGFLLNQKDFSFTPDHSFAWNGTAASGDLNGDGIFDVILVGQDILSNVVQKVFLSKNSIYLVKDSLDQLTEGKLFIADFNTDGLVDISHLQTVALQDTVQTFYLSTGLVESNTLQFLQSLHYMDFEHDGTLDIIQITNPDSIHITFYKNQSSKNLGPVMSTNAIANKIFDRYFFFWAPASDDHTVEESLTYNLMIESADGIIQSADFDILNERQLLNAHGNNLTNNFRLFDQLPSDPQKFAIQAVDNALHAPVSGGICMGTVTLCPLLESSAALKEVCPNETVSIASPANSLWFSFKNGFLGHYDDYTFQAAVSDTLFYYDPSKFDCSALQAYIIKVRDLSTVEYYTRYACENSSITFNVESDWVSSKWSSDLYGSLGNNNTITYEVTEADTVSVNLQGPGCSVLRKTAIGISKPGVTVEHDRYAIMKGSSVQLNASGADRYVWTPADYLSDPAIANPLASPEETTLYTVTGYDSVSCPTSMSVHITVENAGFIPNLFTPNDDGKNDFLRIYGLKEVSEFRFIIKNREGKIVYESKNAFEVLASGWDGTKGGTHQPAGAYFWKVIGQHPSGETVRLNGKTEGSIILVR